MLFVLDGVGEVGEAKYYVRSDCQSGYHVVEDVHLLAVGEDSDHVLPLQYANDRSLEDIHARIQNEGASYCYSMIILSPGL